MTSDDDIREVAAIDFLYKTMVEREPGKRRIKPIESAIMEVYDMMEDSSDDPEYEASDYGGKHSDTCTDDSETASETETSKNRNEHIEIIAPIEGAPLIVIEDTDTGDDDDMDDARALQPSVQPPAQTLETQTLTTQTLATKTLDTKPLDTSVDSLPLATLKLICCVCVMTNNDADNEIVQCDGCNVTVHEGCYGISESHSIQSSDSLTSITPWFCDACKADITPFCELCPSLTGIFKETDTHRWVHLICALYTPNIGFHYPDKLSCISLYEIPMKKWGYKECCLCEEAMYRKTGITVKCDAGMCKRYFHVTCAQREGLLSQDASDEEIADPFYAHCKQHVDQRSKLQKITNYRKLCSNISVSRCILPKANILRKLELYREQYQANKHLSPYETPPPVEKHPRHLNTSSHAVRHLHRKAEFFKDDIKLESAYEAMKKRSQIKDITAVAFSADFVHYYKERESNFSHLLDDLEQLKEQNRILNDELKNTMRIYVDSLNGRNSSETKIIGIANQFLDLWNALKSATSKDIKTPDWMDKLTTPIVREERFLVHTCEQCSSVDKQYAMAQCDNCRLRYHIACLDPPLAKLPLKTKHIGWECNICTQAQSDEDHDKDIKMIESLNSAPLFASSPIRNFNESFETELYSDATTTAASIKSADTNMYSSNDFSDEDNQSPAVYDVGTETESENESSQHSSNVSMKTEIDSSNVSESATSYKSPDVYNVGTETESENESSQYSSNESMKTEIHSSNVKSATSHKRDIKKKRPRIRPIRFCKFCEKVICAGKLKRHIIRNHSNEEQVKSFIKTKDAKHMRTFMNTMRNEGMFIYNTKILNKDDSNDVNTELMVTRQSTGETRFCLVCKAFISAKCVYKHKKKCSKCVIVKIENLKTKENKYENQFKHYLDHFRNGPVRDLILKDTFIQDFGYNKYITLKADITKANTVRKTVMSEMREFARIVVNFKDTYKDIDIIKSIDIFEIEYIDKLLDSISKLSTRITSTSLFNINNLIIRILKHISTFYFNEENQTKESHGTPTESKISNLCCVCSKPVSEFNLKKCFECKLNYHVECIPDDLKPKNRRAKWMCFNCLQQITTPVIKKKDITTKARKSTPSKKYKNKMYFNPDSKRLRSHFTPDQIEGLNNAFDANIFLTGQSRKNVAATLHLSNTQVKIWFQNKRVGLRKQNGGSNTTDSSHGDQPDQGHYTGVKVIIPAILPPDPTSTICLDDEVIIQPRVVPPAEMLLTDLQIDLHTDLHIENPVDDDFFESKKRKRGGTGRRGFRTKGHKKRRGDDEEDDEEKNADDKSDNNDSNSENNVDNSSANSSANSSDNNGDNENVSDHDTETASDDNRDVVEDEPDGQDVNEADGGVEDDEKRGGEYEVDDDYEVDDAEDSDDLLSQSEND